jgi:hypothetical protein
MAFMADAGRKCAAQNAHLLVFVQVLTGFLTFPSGREGIREIRGTTDRWSVRCQESEYHDGKCELGPKRLHHYLPPGNTWAFQIIDGQKLYAHQDVVASASIAVLL